MGKMISEIAAGAAIDDGRKGPKTPAHAAAQEAVDSFIESGFGACEVDWREIDPDFDRAKAVLSSRISWTKFHGNGDELHMRSNRAQGKVYLTR